MKISFVVPEIVVSGGMRIIFEYANRLTNKGHKVTLFTPLIPFNPYKYQFKPHYIKYQIRYFFKCLLGKTPKNIFEKNFEIKYVPLIRNIFIPDADAVVATAWTTAYYVNKLSAQKGKKYYLIQDYEIWNCNVRYAQESYQLPLNRIVISSYLKKLLKEKFNSDSVLILNGINFKKFYNDNKKFHHPASILFMDHSLENKNVEGSIRTVTKLKEKYPDIIIKAFGVRKHHRIPDFVEFHQNLNDAQMRKLYCDSDIFLFPSKYEGFGGPPAEAMGCKCAVVGNAVGALPEYAKNMETAILSDPEKPDELYKGVLYLLENESELKRLSYAGYEYVRKVLDFDRAVNELENLLTN